MEIDYDTYIKMKDVNIIDLRSQQDYLVKHFIDAINVPFELLIVYPERYLLKNKKYLLVCEYGIKSKKTSEILNRLGYYTYSLKNGINNINL